MSLGYKDARAGMYLFDIQKMYPDSQVEEARSEWRDIRYLRYKDDTFVYYYVAVSEYGDAAILYITPAMVSDTVQGKELQEEQAPDNPEITEQTQYVVSGEYGEQLKEQEKQLCDRKEELQLLQLKNNLMELVEKKGNEDEDSYIIYEKYFRMKQGELLWIENSAAFAVKDYGLNSGIGNEEWKLKRICYSEDTYQVYVESELGDELYILLSEGQVLQPNYIVMVFL